jgi:hypothetical protein
MSSNRIRNNLAGMVNNRRDYVRGENSRLGSVEQRSTSYRRNGMLNFGARQMMGLIGDDQVYIIGVGGPPTVS